MAGTAVLKDNVRLYIDPTGANLTAAHKVSNVASIGELGGEAEEIDTTTLDSMAKEFENGFVDNGTVDFVVNITSDEYVVYSAMQDSGVTVLAGISAFNKAGNQIVGVKFNGIIKSCKLSGMEVGGLLAANVSLRISGAISNDFDDPIGAHSGKPVESITVKGFGSASSIDSKGGTLQMIASIEPSDATIQRVKWSVNDPSKATISDSGLLTAKADGSVEVTAEATDGSDVSGKTSITITSQSN